MATAIAQAGPSEHKCGEFPGVRAAAEAAPERPQPRPAKPGGSAEGSFPAGPAHPPQPHRDAPFGGCPARGRREPLPGWAGPSAPTPGPEGLSPHSAPLTALPPAPRPPPQGYHAAQADILVVGEDKHHVGPQRLPDCPRRAEQQHRGQRQRAEQRGGGHGGAGGSGPPEARSERGAEQQRGPRPPGI